MLEPLNMPLFRVLQGFLEACALVTRDNLDRSATNPGLTTLSVYGAFPSPTVSNIGSIVRFAVTQSTGSM